MCFPNRKFKIGSFHFARGIPFAYLFHNFCLSVKKTQISKTLTTLRKLENTDLENTDLENITLLFTSRAFTGNLHLH